MKKIHTLNYLLSALKELAENPYSLLWELCDDMEYNGHIIQVKNSRQYCSVIIDGRYQRIGGRCTIVYDDITYAPLEYVEYLLMQEVRA